MAMAGDGRFAQGKKRRRKKKKKNGTQKKKKRWSKRIKRKMATEAEK